MTQNPFTELAEQLTNEIQRQFKQQPQEPEWLSIDEACKLLNLSKSAVYKKTMNNELPFYKHSKKLMFRQSELVEFITSHRAKGQSLPGIKIEK